MSLRSLSTSWSDDDSVGTEAAWSGSRVATTGPMSSWALDDLAAAPSIRGAVEQVTAGGVRGWCLWASDPRATVDLEIAFLGVPLYSGRTGVGRPDIGDILGRGAVPVGFEIAWASLWFRDVDTGALAAEVARAPHAPAAVSVRVAAEGRPFLPCLPNADLALSNAEMLAIVRERTAPTGGIDSADLLTVDAQICWPGKERPITLALMVDGRAVATEKTAPRASTDGIERVRIAIPADLVDGGTHRIGLLAVAEPPVPVGAPIELRLSVVSEAAWSVRGTLVEGWIVGACDRAVTLDLIADGSVVASVPVTLEAGRPATFAGMLPHQLTDGQTHRLQVAVAGERATPLKHVSGGLEVEFRRRIAARVETTANGAIQGWAFDRLAPDAAVEVELWEGPVLLGRTMSNLTRSDVNKAFGLQGPHGFAMSIPARHFDGMVHHLTLRIGGEEISIAPDKRLPKVLAPSLIADPALRYAGRVEILSAQQVSGWAVNRLAPYEPVSVSIFVDGVCEAVVSADQFQKRLQGIAGSGYHIFQYKFPLRLMNNSLRTVEVFISDGHVPLEVILHGKPPGERAHKGEVFFPLIDYFGATAGAPACNDPYPHRLTNIVEGRPNPSSLRPVGSGDPEVSFILLNWNGAPLLDQMLESVAAHMAGESIELLIVDHGSTDDSLAVIEKYRATLDIRVLARGANFSFSASNNYAAAQARGRYVFLVNNDLVFPSNCLPTLLSWLEQDASVGIVGAGLLEPLPKAGGGWRYASHHRGVQFAPFARAGDDPTFGPIETHDNYSAIGAALEVPAVTGAALLCRREDFLAVGGLDEMYFYGMEDIDLCMRMSRHFGTRIICDLTAIILHNRSFTRAGRLVTGKPNPVLTHSTSQNQNTRLFSRRFKRRFVHASLASAIESQTLWRNQPLRVTFVVSEVSLEAPAGDFSIALEMAEALRSGRGWEVVFALPETTDMIGTDVLVVMRPDFDLAAVRNGNPGMVSVAWIGDRVDRWQESAHLQGYNLLFCTSSSGVDAIAGTTGRTAHLLPLAANEERFHPGTSVPHDAADVVFVGSRHDGRSRAAVDLLGEINLTGEVAIYGFGWDRPPQPAGHWRGPRRYDELPEIYASAKIVVDDSRPDRQEWGALNAQVFDVLASGSLAVTNCRGGSQDLFGGRLPTFAGSAELANLLKRHLDHPAEREALAAALRAEVLEKHTYRHRAETFKSALAALVRDSLRFAIKVAAQGADDRDGAETWQMALGLQRALHRAGHFARVDLRPDWGYGQSAGDDVVIVLHGGGAFEPMPSKINILWLTDGPDDLPLAEFDRYDHVFVASAALADRLKYRLGDRVSTLLPCVDPEVFRPVEADPETAADVAFVGGGHGGRPAIVDAALQAGIAVRAFGPRWDGQVPAGSACGMSLAMEARRACYSGAGILLHQHSDSMRREGIVSTWLMEAGACGAAVISDDLAGLSEIFGDTVAICSGAEDLAATTRALLADGDRRRAMGADLRRIIVERHSPDRRVQDILKVVETFR
ncbi:hypothetical protein C2U72_10900 [Prosthecomicrobium hirschii]|nr:hypothetical protein C2U72_10900 [Prosthecomicrobium hirschii]